MEEIANNKKNGILGVGLKNILVFNYFQRNTLLFVLSDKRMLLGFV